MYYMINYHIELKVNKSIIIINKKLTLPPFKRAMNKLIIIVN